eukprot:4264133-Prymnesium_polylepis.2
MKRFVCGSSPHEFTVRKRCFTACGDTVRGALLCAHAGGSTSTLPPLSVPSRASSSPIASSRVIKQPAVHRSARPHEPLLGGHHWRSGAVGLEYLRVLVVGCPQREVVAEQLHDEGRILVALLVERVEL